MDYQFRVRIPPALRHLFNNQKRFQKRFETKQLGKIWARDRKQEIDRAAQEVKHRGESVASKTDTAEDVEFREAFAGWAARPKIRATTAGWYERHYKAHIKESLGSRRLSELSLGAVDAHLARRIAAGASKSNVGRDVVIIQGVIRWAMSQGYRVDITALAVRKPPHTPTFTRRFDPDALKTFLASVEGRDRSILEIAAATGLRAGELRAFDCSWILWDQGRIQVPHDEEFSPKGRAARSVPLYRELEALLRGWLCDRCTGLVFPPLRARSFHGANKGADLGKVFLRAKNASGIDFHGLHDLRHHYCSHLLFIGVDPRTVQEIMGHKSLATTQGYAHVSPKYLSAARDALESAQVGSKVGSRRKLKAVK